MCIHIVATLPGCIDRTRAADVFKHHNLAFTEITNPHVASQITPGDLQIQPTRWGCDCGTPLGSANEATGSTDSEASALAREVSALARLRRQGWSEAKIERWLEDKARTKAREDRIREQASRASEYHDLSAQEWVDFIKDLLGSRSVTHVTRIGLFLHFGTALPDERIHFLGQSQVTLRELSPTVLLGMEEDCLYEFVR